MGNPFCWMELTTHNLEGAKEFYSKAFDWQVTAMDESPMPYMMVQTGSEPGGGMMSTPEPGIPTSWTIYISVDDLKEACGKVEANGGKVWKGPQEVPGIGSFAIACDPQGAYFGLWEELKK